MFNLSRSIQSRNRSHYRLLHGLQPHGNCGHPYHRRGAQRRYLLGLQGQPSGHLATLRRHPHVFHQLHGQPHWPAGAHCRGICYWRKGSILLNLTGSTDDPISFVLNERNMSEGSVIQMLFSNPFRCVSFKLDEQNQIVCRHHYSDKKSLTCIVYEKREVTTVLLVTGLKSFQQSTKHLLVLQRIDYIRNTQSR